MLFRNCGVGNWDILILRIWSLCFPLAICVSKIDIGIMLMLIMNLMLLQNHIYYQLVKVFIILPLDLNLFTLMIPRHSSNSYYVIMWMMCHDLHRFTFFNSSLFRVFIYFYTMIRTQFEKNIKIIHMDSSSEYISKDFEHFLATKGIIQQRICHHQSQ